MANQQQALILDTIVGMKKAIKRKAYESDSDSAIEHNTNRGHKLQKRARFVRRGHLPQSMAPGVFKQVVEHAGFRRAILNPNPPLIDEEGYDIDSDDNEERVQEAMAAAADANPYSSIQLEQLLAPLTSLDQLPDHPTLSRPFTSKTLTGLVDQASGLMHRENAALWKVRPLLTRLQGDHTWAPCGMMVDSNDFDLFSDDPLSCSHDRPAQASISRSAGTPIPSGSDGRGSLGEAASAEDGAGHKGETLKLIENKKSPKSNEFATDDEIPDAAKGSKAADPASDAQKKKSDDADATNREDDGTETQANGQASGEAAKKSPNGPSRDGQTATTTDVEMAEAPEAESSAGKPANPGSTHSGSRALSISPDMAEDRLFIHRLFLPPRTALPDRDQGLPEPEADDVRRLLQLYIQKQEEVCRGTEKLHMGLLKADRYRKTVLKWSKAEAHCGDKRDMSDGEDWYDKEEWGLVDDLKKGQDEEEEDTAQTQKKTRNRR